MELRWDVVGWAAVALLLFAAEALAPGAFMLWMGLAAAAVFLARRRPEPTRRGGPRRTEDVPVG